MKTVPFAELLKEAVNKEGILSTCYSRFHQYSIGNQLWLWDQVSQRDEQLGPVATFKKWNRAWSPRLKKVLKLTQCFCL
jgi:hypothetical protein